MLTEASCISDVLILAPISHRTLFSDLLSAQSTTVSLGGTHIDC